MDDENFVEIFKQNVEKIDASNIYLSLVTENYVNDAYCALQLGIAILLGKPVYLLVKDSTQVPEKLRAIADKIETFTEDSMQQALDRLLKE